MANGASERETKGNNAVPRGAPITHQADITATVATATPRAQGTLRITTKLSGTGSVLDRLRPSGSFKCLFPRPSTKALEAVLLNTAGGVTGGDHFSLSAEAGDGTDLTLTTQACERAYRAQPGETGRIRNRLHIGLGARLNWLPQETILFNGSALDRRLHIDMAADATLLMVEPLVFGRPAMGETLTDLRFRDRIEIRRGGAPLFLDAMALSGDAQAHLNTPFVASGAGAMALVVLVAGTAEGHLSWLQDSLPDTAGASLIRPDVLVMRLLADDGFTLRQTLLPVLHRLNGSDLPRCWMM